MNTTKLTNKRGETVIVNDVGSESVNLTIIRGSQSANTEWDRDLFDGRLNSGELEVEA